MRYKYVKYTKGIQYNSWQFLEIGTGHLCSSDLVYVGQLITKGFDAHAMPPKRSHEPGSQRFYDGSAAL